MALKLTTTNLLLFSPPFSLLRLRGFVSTISYCTFASNSNSSSDSINIVKKKKKKNEKENDKYTNETRKIRANSVAVKKATKSSSKGLVKEKRRTRSQKEFDDEAIQFGDTATHIPVMLAEILDVFSASSPRPLRSFVDCTLGAAGHSAAIIQAHPELKFHVGMDVDPIALEKAQARIAELINADSSSSTSDLKAFTFLKNFKYTNSLLREADEKLLDPGVDGILMDLGMSSMQVNNPERGFSVLGDGPLDMRMDPNASLKAEDILNSWPDTELGQILREYGEESNWRVLQNKIVKARSNGGLHSTSELVNLIRSSTHGIRGGRQGWIKTATRVFQALRIAVNDELKTLEDSLYASFDCLAPGGRLAVISFHSLEDRVVKQTFLDIINSNAGGEVAPGYGIADEECKKNAVKTGGDLEKEVWIRQMIQGRRGIILTKRPITPSEEEEKLNSRSRSAKLRVIQKVEH